MRSYPDVLAVPTRTVIDRELAVPGSKSLTNRALLVAALAAGESRLEGALVAEDSEVMIAGLRELGIPVEVTGTTFVVHGRGGHIPQSAAEIDLRLSGTSIRFLTALASLGNGRYQLDGNERMRQRPIQDLLLALDQLGARVGTRFESGCPPVVVEARGLRGGDATVAGERSSQYLSALLMVAPYAARATTLSVDGELQSKPFVDMTLALMGDFGVTVRRRGYREFHVPTSRYRARAYHIEGDAMAAGYFWAAAAVTGGKIRITNLGRHSWQGDRRLADVLEQMGCTVIWSEGSCEVIGPPGGRLRGGRFDLNDMPDQAQTLAVTALFADTPVRIDNVWNMRIKETDRLVAMARELAKFGAEVQEGRDYLVVHAPPELRSAVEVDTYGDHRMAMAFAVAGLRIPGVVIRQPACVAKTYPGFFRDWSTL